MSLVAGALWTEITLRKTSKVSHDPLGVHSFLLREKSRFWNVHIPHKTVCGGGQTEMRENPLKNGTEGHVIILVNQQKIESLAPSSTLCACRPRSLLRETHGKMGHRVV